MPAKEYVVGCAQGELDRIYITEGGISEYYNTPINMVTMTGVTAQTIILTNNPQFEHLSNDDLNQYHTYFGYRIKNNADTNDKNKYILYQYRPTSITDITEYGDTKPCVLGQYRYVVADITDGIVTILNTVYEYNAGSANLNVAYGIDGRSHGGIRSMLQYENVILGVDDTIGTYIGVLPCALVQFNDNTSVYTCGNTRTTVFAIPFSRVSSYDPTPDVSSDPYRPGGTSGEGGGNGDFDPHSDPVPRPTKEDLNPVSVISCGLTNYFHANKANLLTLGQSLFTDNILQMLKNYFANPFDIIAGIYMLPVKPTDGELYYPKIGLRTFGVQMPIILTQYAEQDCGSIYVGEFYGGAFDYAPYSKVSIFLPFIGVRELNIDEVMGKWLYVKYLIDIESGDCIAFVMIGDGTAGSETVRYQFPGNCAQQIPFSAASFDSAIKNAVSFATVAVSSVITAGAAAGAVGAAGAALEAGTMTAEEATIANQAAAAMNAHALADVGASGLSAVMGSKPIIERSGAIGANTGFMSVLKPFLIWTIPRQSLPDNYPKFYGYPANIESTLAGMSGYTVVDSVKLHGIPGTDAEIAEIETMLKGGVVL